MGDKEKEGTEHAHVEHSLDAKEQPELLTLDEIMEKHKPNPWGRGYMKLYLMSALIFLCSTMNGVSRVYFRGCEMTDLFASGYDGSLMGSINALPNYTKYYNLPEGGSVSTGIVFAIYQVCTLAY